MAEAPVLVENGVENGADLAPLTGFRNVVNGQFTTGNPGGPGRPKGYAIAARLLDKSAPSLTRDLITRSKKSDKLLAKAIDKVLPDAGRTDTILSVSLTRSDVLAELRRRGVDESAMLDMKNQQTS